MLDLLRDGRVFLPLTVSKEAFLIDLEYFGLLEPQGEEHSQEDDGSSSNEDGSPKHQQQPKAKQHAVLPKFDIQQGGLAEIANLVQVVEGNVDADLQTLDEQIQQHNRAAEECEKQKDSIQTAHAIFKRSCCAPATSWTRSSSKREGWERTTVKFKNNNEYSSVAHDTFTKAANSLKVKDFLKVRLEAYGLTLIKASGNTYQKCEFVVERRCNGSGGGGGESKSNDDNNSNNKEEEEDAPAPPPAKKQRRGAKKK